MPIFPRRRLVAVLAAAAAVAGSLATGLPTLEPARAATPKAPPAANGYWMVATDGGIFSFGDAPFWGSTGDIKLNKPIVGMAPTRTPGGKGYWMVASDGGIFAFGDAPFHGSTGAIKLNKPIVGMAPTPSGKGYWMVASDGGIFAFGDAPFHGSTGAIKLAKPIVGMAATPSGKGYWMVASDGGIFAFGDAEFFGSGQPSGKSFAAMATTATGKGYWLASANGEVLPFGDAAPLGSANAQQPVVGMIGTATAAGYWLVTNNGTVFGLGDARDFGSTAGMRLNQPMVGFAAAPGTKATTTESTTPTTAPVTTTTMAGPDPGPETFAPKESRSGPNVDPPATDASCGLPSKPKSASFPENGDIGSGSGMAESTKYPGVYWVIRDGGLPTPALFPVRWDSDGQPTSTAIPIRGAQNSDWEEITYSVGADGRGRLWIVDSGDRGVRRIYEVLEPNPDGGGEAEILGDYTYALPGVHAAYVVEGAMMHRGYLVVVGKRSPHAPIFIFNKLVAGQTNVPTYLGTLGDSSSISMIRKSPDGKMLVTASHEKVQLYRSTDGSGSLASFVGRPADCRITAFPGDNVESGEWLSNQSILFLDEHRKSFRLTVNP